MSSGGVSSDTAALLTSKGLELFRKGDFNSSLIALNESLDRDPYTPKTWMVKGDVLASMGRYDEAISAYNRVVKLDPADPTAYAKIGDALVNEGKFSEAVVSFDHALAANPGLIAVQVNRTRAIDLASDKLKGTLITTQPTIVIATTISDQYVVSNISPVTTVPLPTSTTKAPLSIMVLLAMVPITGIVSLIFKRKK
jgi:tetratricopeptide (TPR) repeat protein